MSSLSHFQSNFKQSIQDFYIEFKLNPLLKKANASKAQSGVALGGLLQFFLASLFSRESFHHVFQAQSQSLAVSENTFRNFLNDGRIFWERFVLLVSHQLIQKISPLTSEDRKNVFIVDDSMFERPNGKKVELSALQFDHAKKRYTRGFRFLQVGWSDGNSFFPLTFSLLSGDRQKVESLSDLKSNAGKRRKLAQEKGTDVTVKLLESAVHQGIPAHYVLFDSWFSSPKMFHAIHGLGLDTLTMVKRSSKVYYQFEGSAQNVKQIFERSKKRRGRSRYLLEATVEVVYEENTLPVKLVYVRNRKKRKEYLVLASSDVSLTAEEVIALYGKRWAIEVYFKLVKQYLHLTEYQGLSYDGVTAQTALVTLSYLILALQHRESTDERTMGELFFLMLEELTDIGFVEAIEFLFSLFETTFQEIESLSEEIVSKILEQFLQKLPKGIKEQFSIV